MNGSRKTPSFPSNASLSMRWIARRVSSNSSSMLIGESFPDQDRFREARGPLCSTRGINGLEISYSFREDRIFHRKLRPGPCNARHGDGFVSAATGGFARGGGVSAPAPRGGAGGGGGAGRGGVPPGGPPTTPPPRIPVPA